MIKIDFSFETQYGRFADALHLPDDHTFTEQEIEDMKQQRLNNWLDVIENPPVVEAVEETVPSETIEIAGEVYQKLDGVPPSGAKLIEANGIWYYKVQG